MKRLALIGALLISLLLPLGGSPATADVPVARAAEASAKIRSTDGVLSKGCPGHRYRYAIDVPAGDSWSLEVYLVSRTGRSVAFSYKVMGGDPQRGKGRLQYCSLNVRPGRYKVKALLTWSHHSDVKTLWAKPRTIHLRRP